MIKHLTLGAALATMLGGCVTVQPTEETPPAAAVCNAAPAQKHIGHPKSEAMGATILKDTGARTLRWGGPDTAWTMDYRQDRVGVRHDANGIITAIECG